MGLMEMRLEVVSMEGNIVVSLLQVLAESNLIYMRSRDCLSTICYRYQFLDSGSSASMRRI
jgi:hypothetical protein